MTCWTFGQPYIRIDPNSQPQNRRPLSLPTAHFLFTRGMCRYGVQSGTLVLSYGDTWRLHRRIFHQALNARTAENFRPMQCAKARQLIINLAEDPQRFSAHLLTFVRLSFLFPSLNTARFRYSTSIIMSVVYGYDTSPINDPWVKYVQRAAKAVSKAVDPKRGALLGMFPFRRFRRMSYSLIEFHSSPETPYMDARLIQSRSSSIKALCNWYAHSSF